MSYTIQYKSESLENLEKLDRKTQSRVIKKIIWLAENFEDITPSRHSASLRCKVKMLTIVESGNLATDESELTLIRSTCC